MLTKSDWRSRSSLPAYSTPGLLAFLRREVLAPGQDLHAECLGDPRDPGAELAEPDHAQRLALEVVPDGGLPHSPDFMRAFS